MEKKNNTERLFASLLIIGGIFGIAIAIILTVQLFEQSGPFIILMLFLAIPFTWAAYTGLRLWQGTPYGYKWAPIIYAAQIPTIQIPELIEYQWFTGFEFSPVIKFGNGDTFLNFNLNLGANAQFSIGSGTLEYLIGCNLFAIAAFILLSRSKQSFQPTANTTS